MPDLLLWPRRFAKSVLARAVDPFLPSNAPLILVYHRVVEDFDRERQRMMQGTLVSQAMLARHLECIGRVREFTTLDELSRHWASGRPFTRPLAAVTFDDGYRDVYENAFPILQRRGIPAAVFVVTSLVGTSLPQTHDRVYRLLTRALPGWANPSADLARLLADAGVSPRRRLDEGSGASTASGFTRRLLTGLPRARLLAVIDRLETVLGPDDVEPPAGALPMTWSMLCEMRRAGVIVGSHTRHHVLMPQEPLGVMRDEAVRSRRDLEAHVEGPIEHFAYPDGAFNQDAMDAIEQAGYRFGYTACAHRDASRPWLTIPRRTLWEHSAVDSLGRFSAPMLRCQAQGLLAGRRGCTWYSHA
jgi:peptidoglycan/xylan/chitin deacetylase (PgdA/CDA1 family)